MPGDEKMRRTETYRISGSRRESWVGNRKWFVPPFVLVLLLLGESLALAAASGSVHAKPVTDSLGKISTVKVTAILYSDDTLAWDYTFAQGSWAKLDCYVDGKKGESLLDFVVWYGPSPYDTRNKLFSFDWNPASLQPGVHEVAFRMADWYGGYNWVEGNIIAEDSLLVHVDPDGNRFSRADEESNQGNTCEQRDNMLGNPINAGIGNKFEQATDLLFLSAGIPLKFTRAYNSRSTLMGALGYGWTHNYSTRLIRVDALHLRIQREDGGQSTFFKNPDNKYRELSGRPTFVEEQKSEMETVGWVWDRLNGTKYHFNKEGTLNRIVRDSNETTLSYDTLGRLSLVTDKTSGRKMGFNYAGGLLRAIIDPSLPLPPAGLRIKEDGTLPRGVFVLYGQDVNDNLVSVTYQDGSGFEYNYADPQDIHNVTEKRDKMGHFKAGWSYDQYDRATVSQAGDGRNVTVAYTGHNTVQVTDAYGRARTLLFETLKGQRMLKEAQGISGCLSCGREVVRKSYTLDSRLEQIEYANGRVDRFENIDSRGNAQTLIKAFGGREQKTIQRTYHPFLNTPLSETAPSVLGAGHKVTLWDFDNDGNSVPNERPKSLLGRRIDQGFTKDTGGNIVPYEHITTYSYNEKEQIASIDGPRPGDQDKITFTYYPNGDLRTMTQPLVGTTTFSRYDSAGRVGRIQDTNGRLTNFTYDARGRIRSRTIVTANGPVTHSYLYNRAGDLRRIVNPEGTFTNFTYEGLYGRLVSITDPMAHVMRFHYDGQGNRDEVKLLDPSTPTPTFRMRYDFQHPIVPGKLWKAINPDSSYTEYDYDEAGQLVSIQDPNGRATFYDYDVLNRLASVTRPGNILTAYDYDSDDNLVQVTDPRSKTTAYTYDDLGRVLAVTSPDTGTTTYTYDQAGNLASRTDAKGVRTTYEYDVLNRLAAIRYPRPSRDLLLAYDQGVDGKGRLTSVQDSSGTTTYQYDELGRLVIETRTMDTVSFFISYTYELNGEIRSITYPSGLMVEYERNAAGRIVSTKANGAPITRSSTYYPFGPLRSLYYGESALPLSRSYDQRYLLNEMTAAEVFTSHYDRYPNGDVKGIRGLREPVLSSASSRYDYLGNRLVGITGSHRATYTYDLNGNVASDGTLSFDYDEENRLTEVHNVGAAIARYDYDGQGRRVKKVAGTRTLYYHYDMSGNLIGESGPAGTALRDYIYQEGERVAMQIYDSQAGTYFFLNDHLGTPRKVIDPGGHTVWEGAYLPFGEAQTPVEEVTNPFRFPGQYFDDETGLHYNYHRYYDPKTGRYLTPDPLGFSPLHMTEYSSSSIALNPAYHKYCFSSKFIEYLINHSYSFSRGKIPRDNNLYVYAESRTPNIVDPTGTIAFAPLLYFAGAKTLALATAYLGIRAAQGVANIADACEVDDKEIDRALGSVLVLNGAEIGTVFALNAGVVYYPYAMVAAGTPEGQKLLSDSVDFIYSAVPATAPAPNMAGLIGYSSGAFAEWLFSSRQ